VQSGAASGPGCSAPQRSAPELPFTNDRVPVCSFGLAVNRVRSRNEEVDFFDISAWRELGEAIANYKKKGDPILVEGRLQYRTWEAQDGSKRSKVDVVADNVQFLGGRLAERATEIAEILNKSVITIEARTGEDERLFGSVTAANIYNVFIRVQDNFDDFVSHAVCATGRLRLDVLPDVYDAHDMVSLGSRSVDKAQNYRLSSNKDDEFLRFRGVPPQAACGPFYKNCGISNRRFREHRRGIRSGLAFHIRKGALLHPPLRTEDVSAQCKEEGRRAPLIIARRPAVQQLHKEVLRV
jgi:single stranded DNA-binding protein